MAVLTCETAATDWGTSSTSVTSLQRGEGGSSQRTDSSGSLKVNKGRQHVIITPLLASASQE